MIEFLRRGGALQCAGAEDWFGAVSHASTPSQKISAQPLVAAQNQRGTPEIFSDDT
jgi:hypothetical protein